MFRLRRTGGLSLQMSWGDGRWEGSSQPKLACRLRCLSVEIRLALTAMTRLLFRTVLPDRGAVHMSTPGILTTTSSSTAFLSQWQLLLSLQSARLLARYRAAARTC